MKTGIVHKFQGRKRKKKKKTYKFGCLPKIGEFLEIQLKKIKNQEILFKYIKSPKL